jgi:hypothetical protein
VFQELADLPLCVLHYAWTCAKRAMVQIVNRGVEAEVLGERASRHGPRRLKERLLA